MELINTANPKQKKIYQAPKLKKYGNVSTLTLKSGSNTDGLGGLV
jgi:hypothetical protein